MDAVATPPGVDAPIMDFVNVFLFSRRDAPGDEGAAALPIDNAL